VSQAGAPAPGEPTPPIEFGTPAADIRSHFREARVELTPSQVRDLSAICPVDTSPESIAEHGRDWWPIALAWALEGEVPSLPSVVARPRSAAEVASVLKWCNDARSPVTPAAGRSSVVGGAVPLHGGVSLDLCGLSGILNVDDESLVVDVAAGTFGPDLENHLRRDHGITIGHWPQSMALSTVGGWLACRGAGQYSTRYGKIEDIVTGLEVALADGRVIRTGGQPRAATGPDLTQLFVGSEGTLGVITSAELRAHRVPTGETRSAWAFPTFAAGLDACREILQRGATPAVLRLYDDVEANRNYQTGNVHVLLVLDEADPIITTATEAIVADACSLAGGTPLDAALVERWMQHRNDTSGLQALTRKGFVVDTMEVTARWSDLREVFERVRAAILAVPDARAATCHQSHSYPDGACLYFTFAGTPARERRDAFYNEAWAAGTTAALAAGANLSHHHGVGMHRARFMPDALGHGLDVLNDVKRVLDPHGILNPGKLGLHDAFAGPSSNSAR
jgi:alkyldihydroxyacetonephosphate synthase